MKHFKLFIVLALLLALGAACWAYVADYYPADEAAVAALAPLPDIRVEQNAKTIAFIPEDARTGFIFYPGGKVEHSAYAPLMRALAENGVLCVLTEMPLKLAVLDMNAAEGIPEQFPQIQHWYIGGHSLGGSMAASHASKNAESYAGLVLLASYSTSDLRASGLDVISIYGSEDAVLDMAKYAENRANLPASLEEHIIEGGNHAGFGSYGAQDGDGTPSVTAAEQLDDTVRLLLEFFE